jgi:N-methylhydantoinase B
VPPWGVNGGAPGARARKILEKSDGTQQHVGNKIEDLEVAAGDVLHFITWGGGGWGDPLARAPELVALEIRRGLVTVQGARCYGVVMAADGSVDADATAQLRADMKSSQRPGVVFDFGPGIDQLREHCLAETGLPAPRAPEWAVPG